VEAQWVAQSRGHVRFRCEQPPYSILVRGIEGSVLPTCQKYGMGVMVWSPLAGGWLTGRIRRDTGVDMTSNRAQRLPLRFDPAVPGNQAKFTAVEELIKLAADAGVSLTHLALAFVTGNPAVTAAIIGPRTMDQLTDLLAGASLALDDDVLDRIDAIVPPGVTLNPADAGWQSPALADSTALRRPRAARSAR
jgi:aryl-alcohol dehydrogenase-like predicted oxidoreductase